MVCGSAYFSVVMYSIQRAFYSIKVNAERLDQCSPVTMSIQHPAVYVPIEEKEEHQWLYSLITQLSNTICDVQFDEIDED